MLKVLFLRRQNFVFFINSIINKKLNINKNIYILQNKVVKLIKNKIQIYFFNIKFKLNCFIKKQKKEYEVKNNVYFSKLYITGLGFKLFYFNKFLYLLLGYSHYILLSLPNSVKIYCFKKRFWIFSKSKYDLLNFLNTIRMCKKINLFKHKGLFEFKQIKHIIKIKAGKKKQFM